MSRMQQQDQQLQPGFQMAIPNGGGDDMDTPYPVMEENVDNTPMAMEEECEDLTDNSYVDVKLKGPGMPISIRIGGVEASECSILADKEADEPHRFLSQEQNHNSTDKETGTTYKLNNGDRMQQIIADADETMYDTETAFTNPNEVVSLERKNIQSESKEKRHFPGKIKQHRYLKKIDTLKNSKDSKTTTGDHGDILSELSHLMKYSGRHVFVDGQKHLLEVKLTPVEECCKFSENCDKGDGFCDSHEMVDQNYGGSVDRPPEHNYFPEISVGEDMPSIDPNQYAYYGVGRNVDISAQPLDLTIKSLDLSQSNQPLDLSKSCIYGGMYRNVVPHSENQESDGDHVHAELETDFFTSAQQNLSNSVIDDSAQNFVQSLQSYNEENITTNARAEFYYDGDYRDSENPSLDTHSSLTDQEDSETVLATSETHEEEVEGLDKELQKDKKDDSLPSLTSLNINCESFSSEGRQGQPSPQNYENQKAVPAEETSTGVQNIVRLLNNGTVSFEQLVEQYLLNQRKRGNNFMEKDQWKSAAAMPQHAKTTNQGMIGATAARDVDEIPAIPSPAMPNLCNLELVDSEGAILLKQDERVKHRLREKLKKDQL